jgi:excisionase family DNA binding protein
MVVKALPAARYGSVADLAAYAGLSPKTIRRLVAAGKIRGLRVGRRVVIPFEDLDRHILRLEDHRPRTQEGPAMTVAPTPARSGDVDRETGRLIPISDEERQARFEALSRALDEIDQITDETDTVERWADVYRGIDEGRPERPLFHGQY